VAVVRSYMGGDALIPRGVEMGDDTVYSHVRVLLGQQLQHKWVSFPSLVTTPRCVTISLTCFESVVLSGRKTRFRAGWARCRVLDVIPLLVA